MFLAETLWTERFYLVVSLFWWFKIDIIIGFEMTEFFVINRWIVFKEFGGYFVVNGIEKVARILIQQRRNMVSDRQEYAKFTSKSVSI